MASAEDVEVEVGDGLAAVVAGVDDDAEAVGEHALGERGRFFEEMAEEFGGCFGDVGVVLLGNEQQVGGGLRVDVGEGDGVVVLVDGFDGDGVVGDLAEETVRHGGFGHVGYGIGCDWCG